MESKEEVMKRIANSPSWLECPLKIWITNEEDVNNARTLSVTEKGELLVGDNMAHGRVLVFGAKPHSHTAMLHRIKDFARMCKILTKNNIVWETI